MPSHPHDSAPWTVVIEQVLARRQVPSRFQEETKLTFLDCLSVALAAASEPSVRALAQDESSSGPGATLWWQGSFAPPASAAFVNAFGAHFLDFDSIHYTTLGHPGVVILPALAAVAESRAIEPATFLDAYVIGLEVMSRLGRRFGVGLRERGFHPSCVLGSLAAAAATCWLLELPASTTTGALDLCGTSLSGFISSFGSALKPYQVARACRTGVEAALHATHVQAADSPTWPRNLELLAGVADAATGVEDNDWELDHVTTAFKRYPICGYLEETVEKVAIMAAERAWIGRVLSAELRCPGYVAQADRREYPRNRDEARFSLRFLLAMVLTSSKQAASWNLLGHLEHPDTRALAGRLTVEAHASDVPVDRRHVVTLEVTLRDGQKAAGEVRLTEQPGQPRTPEVLGKAHQELGSHLGAKCSSDVVDGIMHFDRMSWSAFSRLVRDAGRPDRRPGREARGE